MDTDLAISIVAVTVKHGVQTVLENFSLTVRRGQTVTLGGPSGCGKSTVLQCVLGLVPPEMGNISITGTRLTEHSVWALRRHLAYVPQEPDLGTDSVKEVLERPFRFRVNSAQRDRLESLPQWLESVDLPRGILNKGVSDLSGGEKQRVALVGALLLDRPILLLDEVTAALDEGRRQLIVDVIRELDCARLIVTHDPKLFGFADQHISLDEGKEVTV